MTIIRNVQLGCETVPVLRDTRPKENETNRARDNTVIPVLNISKRKKNTIVPVQYLIHHFFRSHLRSHHSRSSFEPLSGSDFPPTSRQVRGGKGCLSHLLFAFILSWSQKPGNISCHAHLSSSQDIGHLLMPRGGGHPKTPGRPTSSQCLRPCPAPPQDEKCKEAPVPIRSTTKTTSCRPTPAMKTAWRSGWTLFPPFGHTPPENDSRPHVQPLDTGLRLLALFC